MEAPRLSVVIPTLDAEESLPALLSDLRQAPFPLEILVVDGGSHDETAARAAAAGCRLLKAERGRGPQLAAGARAASATWMLFLHADCRLPWEWHRLVAAFMMRWPGQDRAGYFLLRLDSTARAARRVERLANWRARRLGLPYGDQGLLIGRSLYLQAGGFPPWPLMEDVALARGIGRSRLELLPLPILTSAIRYERDGWWNRPLRNLFCLALYFLGVSPHRLAQLYNRRS